MTGSWYQKTTAAQMNGLRVRTTMEIRNGFTLVPAETVMTIVGKGGGLQLRGDPCEHCGVRVHFRKIPPGIVTLVKG